MNKEYMIEALNLKGETALTLEKARDRVEFEAMAAPLMWQACDNVYCPNEGCGASVIPNPPACEGKVPDPPPPTCVDRHPCDDDPDGDGEDEGGGD